MSNIKLGVSLYSFTAEFARGVLDLEGCFRMAKEMGAEGYEIVATQMIPSYPYISDRVLGQLTDLSHKYQLESICYGANMDRGMIPGRNLSEEEMLAMAINDIKSANKLGCKVIREQYLLSPSGLRKLAPYAEDYNVKVGIEIHNPEYPTSDIMNKYLDEIIASGSRHIGLIPDFGCFATKPNKPHWDQALAKGAPEDLLKAAADMRYSDVPLKEAGKRLLDMGANSAVMEAFSGMYGFVTFRSEPDLEGLKSILPYCVHFHGKFHHIFDDLTEASIPYPEILKVIMDSDFNGYIMSEYEDHTSGNALLMTRRHLEMEKKLLSM